MESYSEAIRIGKGNITVEAEALTKSGNVYLKKLEYKEALDNYNKAIKLFDGNENYREEADAYACLGRLLIILGDQRESENKLTQTMKIYQKLYLDYLPERWETYLDLELSRQ